MDLRVTDGNQYDITVDIYSLGLIFYAIFKGKGIFDHCKYES